VKLLRKNRHVFDAPQQKSVDPKIAPGKKVSGERPARKKISDTKNDQISLELAGISDDKTALSLDILFAEIKPLIMELIKYNEESRPIGYFSYAAKNSEDELKTSGIYTDEIRKNEILTDKSKDELENSMEIPADILKRSFQNSNLFRGTTTSPVDEV